MWPERSAAVDAVDKALTARDRWTAEWKVRRERDRRRERVIFSGRGAPKRRRRPFVHR